MQNVLSLSKRIPVVAEVKYDEEEKKPVDEAAKEKSGHRTWT